MVVNETEFSCVHPGGESYSYAQVVHQHGGHAVAKTMFIINRPRSKKVYELRIKADLCKELEAVNCFQRCLQDTSNGVREMDEIGSTNFKLQN